MPDICSSLIFPDIRSPGGLRNSCYCDSISGVFCCILTASISPSISCSSIGNLRAFVNFSPSQLSSHYSNLSNNTVNMTTSFDSLPIVDLSPLSANKPYESDISALAQQLHDVFATTGFAYLINAPLSFSHDDVFSMAKEFFDLPEEEKMKLAKRTFREQNSNTYRGYAGLALRTRSNTNHITKPPQRAHNRQPVTFR